VTITGQIEEARLVVEDARGNLNKHIVLEARRMECSKNEKKN
jgi:hypothetical protein